MKKTRSVEKINHKEILDLHNELRKNKKLEWDRVLPFEELLFDRWEKAKFLKAGEGASIYHNSYIFGKVRIGKNSWIGPYTILDGSGGGIKIGDYCSVSAGVQIYTHDTVNWSVTGGKADKDKGKVSVGNYCYLGPNSVISKGITIGQRSVIGAQSLVNKNIPANSIVYGIPGRIVGRTIVQGNTMKKEFFE